MANFSLFCMLTIFSLVGKITDHLLAKALSDHVDKASEAKAWNAYYEANRRYAEALAEVYQPGDLVRYLTPFFIQCMKYGAWYRRTGLDTRLPFNVGTKIIKKYSSRRSDRFLFTFTFSFFGIF